MIDSSRRRLDAELVRRGHAPTRGRAVALISSGHVEVDGVVVDKPSADVMGRVVVVRDGGYDGFVSRGADKLTGALDQLRQIAVPGRRCLDAGASTGGFTEVLLRRGASRVVAVDVGHGQLAERLRNDHRVDSHEGTNVRSLDPVAIGGPAELTVADLSFISLTVVLSALARCTALTGELLLLVKPQFEVGRDRLGAGGVVRSPELRVAAIETVLGAADSVGLFARAVTRSIRPGPAGNVEFFVWFDRNARLSGRTDPRQLLALAAGEILGPVCNGEPGVGP